MKWSEIPYRLEIKRSVQELMKIINLWTNETDKLILKNKNWSLRTIIITIAGLKFNISGAEKKWIYLS
ncbi:hypothetical protein MSBRW_2218 [Methanosarcina barkeri str. Wiesmoor]|uniref:Uncharacterized protein n=1 Tax=Methanosarcina barkeri str. Wiesmoor TaxID=1434109 RepID=A0A0E3LLL3_METBA|nr:hypothetical protein MSBRW_2218 [Methanosarcina barkeri str. Wiesmoor]